MSLTVVNGYGEVITITVPREQSLDLAKVILFNYNQPTGASIAALAVQQAATPKLDPQEIQDGQVIPKF